MTPAAGSVPKVFSATARYRRSEIGHAVAGADAVAWDDVAFREVRSDKLPR